VHSILTSHRIVGPLYRFRVVFSEVKAGNLVPWVGLRRRDLLIKEADALNEMLVSLRDRVSRIAAHQTEARRHLAGLEQLLETNSTDEARTQLANLEQSLQQLEQQVNQFHLQGN